MMLDVIKDFSLCSRKVDWVPSQTHQALTEVKSRQVTQQGGLQNEIKVYLGQIRSTTLCLLYLPYVFLTSTS